MKNQIKYFFQKIHNLFLWASGAELKILKQVPIDQNKYFGIGGTIIFTALMAGFAGGYAFYTAFENEYLSVFFGIFWGALILNLDRYIVSTFGVGDGKRTISKQELKEAAPRLIMAIILGFVIATPLELKIFEKEITTVVERLKIEKAEELKSIDSSSVVALDRFKERMVNIEADIKNYQQNQRNYLNNSVSFIKERKQELMSDRNQKKTELSVAQRSLNKAYNNYIFAKKDTSGRYSDKAVANYKLGYKNRVNARNNYREELSAINSKITEIEENRESTIKNEKLKIDKQISLLTSEKESLLAKIEDMERTIRRKSVNYENKVQNYNGFAAHLEALGILTSEKDSIFYAKWLITILFIFIEIAPILFKMMTERGPYDDIIDKIKHEIKVKQLLEQSNLNEEINTAVKVNADKNSQKLNSELLANKDLLNSIAKAQAEIAQVAIDEWKKEQIEKMKKDPSIMIKS